jgi:hypothetical protein
MGKAQIALVEPEDGANPAQHEHRQPVAIVALGRGKTGKSLLLRWLAETTQRRRKLRIVDAEMNNRTLARYVPEAETSPAGVDNQDRRRWVEDKFSDIIEAASDPATSFDMLLDVGGNDTMMKRLGAEQQLVAESQAAGVRLVAIHMIGPDLDDLSQLEEIEGDKLFCPRDTVLMLNAGLVKGEADPTHAFRPVIESAIARKVISAERGGRVAVMPNLDCLQEMETKGIPSFQEALTRMTPPETSLRPLRRSMVRTWLRRMDEDVRQKLADILP